MIVRRFALVSALGLAVGLSATRAHAGPQDIPPPGEVSTAPEPVAPETAPSAPLTERFHLEASFLFGPKYDVMLDDDDSAVDAGSHNGHGFLFGGEAFASYRLTESFHVGLGARFLSTNKRVDVNAHALQIPVRLTWYSAIARDTWLAYGVGAGFARVWLTTRIAGSDLPLAENGAYAEARVALVRRLFATVDALVSVGGFVGPFITNGFGSYGLTLGVGLRFGA